MRKAAPPEVETMGLPTQDTEATLGKLQTGQHGVSSEHVFPGEAVGGAGPQAAVCRSLI